MGPEEKAFELYSKFQQYYWDEIDGWMPDDLETKNVVNKVIDELEIQSYTSVDYWREVKHKLNSI